MKLSIIMPLYNVEEWINKCLDSIPIRDDVEIIMVENGSTDNTLAICKQYATMNKNCHVLHFENQLGCGKAINVGYDLANGDYVLQLDGDDYLYTDELNAILDNDMSYDLIYFNMKDNDNREWKLTDDNRSGLPDHTSLIKRSFLGNTRMVLNPNNIHDIGHGWKMFQELLNKPHTYYFTDKVVYHYNYPRVGSIFWEETHKG